MNTGTRRFILRLAIGLLAFLIGVTVTWALGRFNPFQSSSGTRYNRGYSSSQNWDTTPEPAFVYPVYRKHGRGCRAKGELGTLTTPPARPLADAPLPPSPPPALR